jgi:hypothetical protein
MPNSGATIQPVEVAQIRCPRCWFSAPFVDLNGTVFRCGRCEWKFSLTAPTLSAAPTFPLTTVTVTNPYPTVIAAAITLNGTTVTGFFVNGASVGTAAGTYLIPVGGVFSATFTGGPPTWAWALPAISAGVSAGGAALPFASGGTSFTRGQALIVDPAGTSDVVVVSGTPTGTSVPVNALNSAHLTGVLVTVAQVAPTHPSVQVVPQTSY